jgi:hypothetical protein
MGAIIQCRGGEIGLGKENSPLRVDDHLVVAALLDYLWQVL